MIIKVQISLHTDQPERQVLITDRSRDFVQVLPLSACPGLESTMADTAPVWRAFFVADVIDGRVHLDERLPEQGW